MVLHVIVISRVGGMYLVSSPDHTLYASSEREGLVSYVEFLGPEAISLHKNGQLESDWSLLNNCVIVM